MIKLSQFRFYYKSLSHHYNICLHSFVHFTFLCKRWFFLGSLHLRHNCVTGPLTPGIQAALRAVPKERPKKTPTDTLDVEIIKTLNSVNRRRQQPKTPPPNRRLITPRQITSETEYRPQTIRMKLTKNETNETVSVSTEILVYEAVKSPINSDDKLVRMNTRQTLARDNSIALSLSA